MDIGRVFCAESLDVQWRITAVDWKTLLTGLQPTFRSTSSPVRSVLLCFIQIKPCFSSHERSAQFPSWNKEKKKQWWFLRIVGEEFSKRQEFGNCWSIQLNVCDSLPGSLAIVLFVDSANRRLLNQAFWRIWVTLLLIYLCTKLLGLHLRRPIYCCSVGLPGPWWEHSLLCRWPHQVLHYPRWWSWQWSGHSSQTDPLLFCHSVQSKVHQWRLQDTRTQIRGAKT